ncbi:hypothetical protein K502DRAFT_69700 [Neoconidiobolus thromboides FSU 785]|nr:hypothetical protein K502DRAFT_69700 [Neoconidiobolus thromboides FSU 785]
MNMKNFLKLKRVEIFASKPPLPKNSRIVPVVKNILTIPTTSLTILCTIFEDGRFVIKAITSFLEPSFYDNKKLKNEQNEEAFVVLQILKFKEFSKHKLNTLFDPLFPSHLYICSRDNGYVVDFTDLINNIKYNHFPEQLGSPCPVNEIISNKKEDIAINDMCFINHKNVESAFLWFIGVNQREEIVSKTKFIKPFIPAPLSKLYSVSKISHLSDQANLYQANKRESGYTFSGFNSKLSFTDRVLDSKDSADITLNALKNKLKGLEANIKHLNLR